MFSLFFKKNLFVYLLYMPATASPPSCSAMFIAALSVFFLIRPYKDEKEQVLLPQLPYLNRLHFWVQLTPPPSDKLLVSLRQFLFVTPLAVALVMENVWSLKLSDGCSFYHCSQAELLCVWLHKSLLRSLLRSEMVCLLNLYLYMVKEPSSVTGSQGSINMLNLSSRTAFQQQRQL